MMLNKRDIGSWVVLPWPQFLPSVHIFLSFLFLRACSRCSSGNGVFTLLPLSRTPSSYGNVAASNGERVIRVCFWLFFFVCFFKIIFHGHFILFYVFGHGDTHIFKIPSNLTLYIRVYNSREELVQFLIR